MLMAIRKSWHLIVWFPLALHVIEKTDQASIFDLLSSGEAGTIKKYLLFYELGYKERF